MTARDRFFEMRILRIRVDGSTNLIAVNNLGSHVIFYIRMESTYFEIHRLKPTGRPRHHYTTRLVGMCTSAIHVKSNVKPLPQGYLIA